MPDKKTENIYSTDEAISEADAELGEPREAEQGTASPEGESDPTVREHGQAEHGTVSPEAEYLKRIEELERRLDAAVAEREARERELLCMTLLGDAGLPAGLAPAVMASEDMGETVELIRTAVRSCVDAELSARCRSETPVTGDKAMLTREELMRLPVAEIQRMRNMGIAVQ